MVQPRHAGAGLGLGGRRVNDLLNTIFGLSGMGFGDPGVEFALARPIPAWGWLLAVILAAALAWYSYWRQDGPRGGRIALGTVRALLLLALLLIFTGPQLVRPNERVEPDWIVVLVDRSASMAIPDAPGPGGSRVTRQAQLEAALRQASPDLARLASERRVLWLGFDAAAYDLPGAEEPGSPLPVRLSAPEGRRTSLGAAVEQALSRVAARPVSGVVVMSDGRSLDEPSRASVRRLQAEQIPVLVLPLGSPEPVTDLAIAGIDAPALAFANDTIPVTVDVDRLGAAGQAPPRGAVQLVDRQTGAVLDEQPLPEDPAAWATGRARVSLSTKPTGVGGESGGAPTGATQSRAWVVRLVPGQADLIEANNQAETSIDVVDRQLRVLLLDGYPRWEFRYLKNLLLRERSIRSSTLLLAANRQYLQEGDVLLDTLPRSAEDWARFDVVIMGDLPGALFSRDQLEQLREHVALRGGGLLWIGGPSSTPGAWRDTPLADLLPFALTPTESPGAGSLSSIQPWAEPVLMRPAPAATRLNVLQLADAAQSPGTLPGWPAALTDPTLAWVRLFYAQRIDPTSLKPAAEVLAEFLPLSEAAAPQSASSTPAVLTMRYGAGRVMYVATDEIWRWRFGRGETLTERFWLPLIRLQGRDALARTARSAALEVAPRRPQVDQPVSVLVRLQDQSLVDRAPPRLVVRVRPLDPSTAATASAVDLTLAPDAARRPGERGVARGFQTTWTPDQPGKYRLEAVDPFLAGAALAIEVDVAVPDDELRRPETDHPLLARLVSLGGPGSRTLVPDDLPRLGELLPRREIRIATTPDVQMLWDRPVVLALLLTLLALEWAGRRLIKLS